MLSSQVTGKATVVPIYRGCDRSSVSNYRPISLTSVVCKQLEHVIAGYLRQVWDKNDWIYEEQRGCRPGYLCESQVITLCQDIVDSLDKGVGADVIITDFSKAFDLVPYDRLLTKLAASGVDLRVVIWVRVGHTERVKSRGATIQGSQSNLRCAARERFGPTTVSSVHK
jgi:hypothetical protein